MNLEGLTLSLLTQHLRQELLGSKIYKVFMPNGHSLLLQLRREFGTSSLLADMNGGSPALYIPQRQPENPEVPPAFCMLLRKHLEEGRITDIYQQDLDRIIIFEIATLGRGSQLCLKKLIFELTGKNANIILTENETIIDSLKHIGPSQSSYRLILPGKDYVAPPPQLGLNIAAAAPEEILRTAKAAPAGTFAKAIIATTTGIGQATAQQLLAAASILPKAIALEPADEAPLLHALQQLQAAVNAPAPQQVHASISRTHQGKTILPLAPTLLEEGITCRSFNDINSAINYAVSLQPVQLPQHELLQKLVSGELQRLQKKLQALDKDLLQAQDADSQRMLADTLMANLYQLQRGQTQVTLYNIYDGEEVTIPLSPILSPSDNAQAYYKRYNKFKRAQKEVQQQLETTQEALLYTESLEASLLTATTKNEIEEIRQEMIAAGLIKVVGKKKKASLPKSQPLHIKLDQDTDLYIGRNNKQNDHVTFTIAGPRDLWFHTKDIPGSHVVLKTTLPQPHQEHVQLAVQLAAFFSKARTGSNVPVDCVQRRYVKKPSGSKPGFVIFTNQNTYYTTPNQQELEKYVK